MVWLLSSFDPNLAISDLLNLQSLNCQKLSNSLCTNTNFELCWAQIY